MAGKLKVIFGGFLRSVHQLWLQVTGSILIIFAVALGIHALKEYRRHDELADNTLSIASATVLSLVTLAFGIHSFWKSGKLR